MHGGAGTAGVIVILLLYELSTAVLVGVADQSCSCSLAKNMLEQERLVMFNSRHACFSRPDCLLVAYIPIINSISAAVARGSAQGVMVCVGKHMTHGPRLRQEVAESRLDVWTWYCCCHLTAVHLTSTICIVPSRAANESSAKAVYRAGLVQAGHQGRQ